MTTPNPNPSPTADAGPASAPSSGPVLAAPPALAFLVLDHAAYALAARPCTTRVEVRAELGRLLGRPGSEHLSVVALPWHHYLALFADLFVAKATARRRQVHNADDANGAAVALWRAEMDAVEAALDIADSYHPNAYPRRRFPRPLHPPTPAHGEHKDGGRVVSSVVLHEHELHEVREEAS